MIGVMLTPVNVPPIVNGVEQEDACTPPSKPRPVASTQFCRSEVGVYDCQNGNTSTAYSKFPRTIPGPAFPVSTLPACTPAIRNPKLLRCSVTPNPPCTSTPTSSGLSSCCTGFVAKRKDSSNPYRSLKSTQKKAAVTRRPLPKELTTQRFAELVSCLIRADPWLVASLLP